MRAVTPKSMVLDLLRVAPRARAVPIRGLVELGALFGFHGNAVRVAVARLMSAGLLESDERGSYRLTERATPVSRIVDEWRLGEARRREWTGDWLAIWQPRRAPRADRRRSQRAMQRLGFAEGLDGMWVRPDNLAASRDELERRLGDLGLGRGSELFTAREPSDALTARWRTLWPTDDLVAGYESALRDLARSAARVEKMPRDAVLVETFMLGGDAIRVLATDPLLPEQIMTGTERHALTRAMIEYDELGRAAWAQRLADAPLEQAPSHVFPVGQPIGQPNA
jgi:phenylacetic acid degradation operon negative regulatory protein